MAGDWCAAIQRSTDSSNGCVAPRMTWAATQANAAVPIAATTMPPRRKTPSVARSDAAWSALARMARKSGSQ